MLDPICETRLGLKQGLPGEDDGREVDNGPTRGQGKTKATYFWLILGARGAMCVLHVEPLHSR